MREICSVLLVFYAVMAISMPALISCTVFE
uniref:Uncharacterized protein n=1 Tax=Rhizophora mucronata TaxID=61149 RepID=A0A2P2JS64_RHIMU